MTAGSPFSRSATVIDSVFGPRCSAPRKAIRWASGRMQTDARHTTRRSSTAESWCWPRAWCAPPRATGAKVRPMTTETLQVTGIRCERCVMRLGKALEGHDGLESANANLMGQVQLRYDEERTSLDALLEKMNGAGFRPVQSFG